MQILIARFSSKQERDQMWRFLDSCDFSLWKNLEPVYFEKGENIGWGAREGGQRIAIRAETMPQHAWGIMSWIASRSSVLEGMWHVLRFDDEEIPLVPSSQPHGEDVIFVNPLGIMNTWTERDGEGAVLSIEEQRAFLENLAEQYEAFFHKGKKEKEKEKESVSV